jgi:hypothetical protein
MIAQQTLNRIRPVPGGLTRCGPRSGCSKRSMLTGSGTPAHRV